MRLVADMVRGMQVGDALAMLKFTPQAAAKPLAKLLRSAVANAEQKGGRVDVDALVVKTLIVDQGPKMRRFMPRAHGPGVPRREEDEPRLRRARDRVGRERAKETNVGQKVHPIGFRLGVIRTWDSKWYEEKNYAKWLHEDIQLSEFMKEKLDHAGIARIEIERAANKAKINIHTARPGIVIGKRGAGIETIKKDLQALTENEVFLNIQEVRKAETNAQLVAENIATQLERRVAFRRAMKKAVQTAMKFGAKGIRVACSGRLGGAEMARYEWYREGRVPLHTLRADIDYGFAEAHDHLRHDRRQGLDLQGRGAAAAAATRAPRRGGADRADARRTSGDAHASAGENQVPQAAEGPHARQGLPRLGPGLRRLRPAGHRARLAHRPPDRGGPRRDHPPRQARRQALDPGLPGQADHQEAGRDPHGQGQGHVED